MKTGIGIGFWEVKYHGVRKDGQVSHLSWGLCHIHIWRGGLGRGWEAPRAGHTVSWSRLSPGAEAGPRLGGWPLGHAATGLLPGLFLTKAECWFSGAPISASPCGFVSVPEHRVQLPCPPWLLALALLASHTCARL